MRESKECVECGGIYFRAEHTTLAAWEARKYCGVRCAGVAGARGAREVKAAKKAAGNFEVPLAAVEVAEVAPEEIIETTESPQPRGAKEPIMRELRIVRVGPNPRLVVCEYFELASRRTCTVDVKRTAKYVRGMKLKLPEPVEDVGLGRPWVYKGPAPRWRGRW